MRRRSLLQAACAAVLLPGAAPWRAVQASSGAAALPREVGSALPAARLRGQGRLTFFGLNVYDARLWAPEGFAPERFEGEVFALELQYLRRLYGTAIAERSLTEMRRVGDFDNAQGERWLAAMKKTFPDVNDGDRIVGLHLPGEGARFYLNGELREEIRDPQFARLFFAIWLSPRTSEPRLRTALIAGGRSAP